VSVANGTAPVGEAAGRAPSAAGRLLARLDGSLSRSTVLAVVVTLVGVLLLYRLNGNYNDSILVLTVCFAFAVLGMVVQIGHSGQLAFHQSVFMMLGAYGVGVLNTKYAVPVLPAILALTAGAAVIGAIIGSVATRVPGFALALATLFLSVIASGYVVYSNYLGQATGITGIGNIWSGSDYVSTLELSGLVGSLLLGGCVLLCARILRSGIGLELSLLGENEPMAASLGINTRRRKLEVFVLSSALAALGGGVFAGTQTLVSPTNFDQTAELTLLIMLFVGGRRTIVGGIVGTVVIEYLQEGNSFVSSHLLIIEGVLFTLILLYAPEGLMGVLRRMATYAGKALRRQGLAPQLAATVAELPLPAPAAGGEPLAGRPSVLLERFIAAPPQEGDRARASLLGGGRSRVGPAGGDGEAVALECRGVTKRFGGVVAVNQVTLEVRGFGVHALCGPNGAGKSTLFELICGGLRADAGEVHLLGHDVSRTPAYLRAQLGVARTLQAVRLMTSRTVLDNVAVAAVPSHRTFLTHAVVQSDLATAYERAWQAIGALGIRSLAHQKVGELTLEGQRTVELARAIVTRPSILFLDEPASGLSATQRGRLADLLVQLGERMTVFLVEHDLRMVMDIAKEIFVLVDGELVFRGDPAAFRSSELVRTELMGLVANEELEHAVRGRGGSA
jgi:branched-chain amino acid transport system permease protein